MSRLQDPKPIYISFFQFSAHENSSAYSSGHSWSLLSFLLSVPVWFGDIVQALVQFAGVQSVVLRLYCYAVVSWETDALLNLKHRR